MVHNSRALEGADGDRRQKMRVRDQCALCFHIVSAYFLDSRDLDGPCLLQGLPRGHETKDSNGENDQYKDTTDSTQYGK